MLRLSRRYSSLLLVESSCFPRDRWHRSPPKLDRAGSAPDNATGLHELNVLLDI